MMTVGLVTIEMWEERGEEAVRLPLPSSHATISEIKINKTLELETRFLMLHAMTGFCKILFVTMSLGVQLRIHNSCLFLPLVLV